ncbi:hypothetical protein [Kitasatospora aureofaciens]|uniref:hypothetical protein n=1 Tax=Kitasatospora aureofaciens TaxID=1894 RepID=UPI00131A8DF5|nr:hypothetical protein [Kitasatospora aureofaciens]
MLDSAELAGASDAARLAAVVILAKSPASHCSVRIRQAELGRWLGFGASHIEHNVLPALRKAGAVKTWVDTDDLGQITGLVCELTALRAAREAGGDHPLRLLRRDLATLLRLCERLLGPGWAPKDRPVTEPGLLAGRRGQGAATDRLALLMLVLQTRRDGRTSLVGGSVARGRGRCAATVARVLGCSVSGGAKVLRRLVLAGAVLVRREETGSGALGRGRLLIPAVAAAHGTRLARPRRRSAPAAATGTGAASGNEANPAGSGAAPGAQVASGVPAEEVDQHPAGAVGDLEGGCNTPGLAVPGFSVADADVGPVVEPRPTNAGLHSPHAVVVTHSGVGAGSVGGCSGSAGGGDRPRPGRAHRREDRPCPLRGEQQVFASPGLVPEALSAVVEPVMWLWSRLPRPTAREFLTSLVLGELDRMSGLVSRDRAEKALRERFVRRVGQQGSAPVLDPVGWMISRGLRQRPDCWSELCDEGVRIDSRASCPSCETERGDARAVRGAVLRELTAAGVPVGRSDLDIAVHREVQRQAAAAAVRREGQARFQVQVEAARQRQRDEARLREAQRLAVPCAGCGLPGVAGRCAVCGWQAGVVELLTEALDLVVAGGGEDRTAIEQVLRADLERQVADLLEPGADEGEVAFARWSAARDLVEAQRLEALERLGRSDEVEAEVRSAAAAEWRRLSGSGDASWVRAEVLAAGERARVRAAQYLLQSRVSAVRAEPRERVDWGARLEGLAARALSEEVLAA